ncbi:MAG TPA: hypothetical protein VH619_12560 [Verrucomicrobiae bacterium]|nr:hypothetical protein [Verrucomicrobiae bacterium]
MQSPISLVRLSALGAVFAVVPLSVHAQDQDDGWNHFGLNFRAGFNISAKFSEASTGAALPPGPGAGAGLNHQYSDGFVNVDSSHNLGGQTWNWGYQHPSQIVTEGEGTPSDVLFHATGGVGGSDNKTDDPNLGFDLNYVRDLVHATWGQFGVKIAFGYTHIQVTDNDPISGGAETVTDEYPLNGVVPPTAPYTGSFSGPGPVLGSQPISRTTSMAAGGGIITGSHDVDAALYDLRLGPSVNIPLFKRFSVQAGGGLALGLVDSDFTYNESGGAGGNTHTDFMPGAYAEVGFAYKVCHSAKIYTGAQYEYLGDFTQSANGRTARLDLGGTIFYELGFEWNF